MKRTLPSIAMATLFAGICLLASPTTMAQSEQAIQPPPIEDANSPESLTCPAAQTFSFGSGTSKFAFCITNHGNIKNLESPATFKHIFGAEGYVACGMGINSASDAGSVENGWNAPSAVAQPNGAHTFPLSITRQSTDGKFELKQTFDWDTTNKEIIITMALKNISGVAITSVKLARYFNGQMDNSGANDRYDVDSDSVWAREGDSSGSHHGLMLSALSFALFHNAAVETATNWGQTGEGCVPIAETVPTTLGDYVGRLTYGLGTLNAGQSKTVKMLYKRF